MTRLDLKRELKTPYSQPKGGPVRMLDLQAYFDRIGYRGPREASLPALQSLHELHPQAIAFENLSPFLGEEVALDLPAIQEKLVHRGRGGWCFEHNLLLRAVLQELGFEVASLGARVRWGLPAHVTTARTHMVLLVNVGAERYVVDAGFGGQTLTGPLRLDTTAEQHTPHEPWRVLPEGAGFRVESRMAGEWRMLYVFDLQPQEQVDYEVTSWYLAKHPRSHFVNDLILARPAPGRRHALRSGQYSLHVVGGETQRRALTDVRETKRLIEETFGVRLAAAPPLDAALARLLHQ